ncbi:MAG: hypothetical protein ACQ9MH_14585 [Nitrospinales bacterium]
MTNRKQNDEKKDIVSALFKAFKSFGTSFLVAWVTVGIIQFPPEATLLGRRFACFRNI